LTKDETNKTGSPIAHKLALVGGLSILLLIPTLFIYSLISDRERRQRDAVAEVSDKWGREQVLTGPVVTVPYWVEDTAFDSATRQNKVVYTPYFAHFLPDELKLTGEVKPKILSRGIYEVVVYEAKVKAEGSFSQFQLEGWKKGQKISWGSAFISLGLSDLRGLQERPSILWGGKKLMFTPGLQNTDLLQSGVTAKGIWTDAPAADGKIPFSFELAFNGSQRLHFTPLGRVTDVFLSSPWTEPSFGGSFLPDERKVSAQGFEAHWNVLDLNRGYPQKFTGAQPQIEESRFGLDLLSPVSVYQKNTRAVKYAIMFISLTFIVFFFVEVMNKKSVHPVQYILVGLALCLYYTLLLSFSEHMHFNAAYWLASGATLSLITLYVWGILKSGAMAGILAGILSVLYGFLFIVLQLQDFALLIGSLGLFIVLAAVMYLSRKIDWYSVK
jgi:inner membrane protein